MSKRGQETQGGEDRYGFSNKPGGGDTADRPQQANAAQMARRKIAQVKKSGASARSSRANTPIANPFAPQQQSMPSFNIPQQGGGDGEGFNFSVNGAGSNPFANSTPPPSFGQQAQQQNGGGMFGNNNTSFASNFAGNAQQPSNGFNFGGNNTNGSNTPSFGGGFGQNIQSQGRQNGATPSSNTPSFSFGQTNGNSGSTFQFGQSQPQTQSTQGTSLFGQASQTNGDKPATPSFGFGQSNQQQDKPATPSFSFGQVNQQPAEKPATPSFSFGQSAQQPAEKPAAPSFSFGQSTQQDKPAEKLATPSFSFGQSNTAQSQANGDKPSFFGAAKQPEQIPKPNTESLFTFNSSNEDIGNKATSDATPKPAEAPKAPTSNLFGAQQQSTGTGLFGATPPSRESSATPKPGDSIFSTQSKPKLGGNLFSSDMAEGEKPQGPPPMFGQPAQPKAQATENAEQTPKPNSLFGGVGQSQAKPVEDTPKPSSNLFSASNFGQTPAQSAAPPKNLFGQSVQDTSMHTPGGTPQKSSLFAPAAAQRTNESAPSETPAPARSFFDRVTRDEETPATTQKESEKPAAPAFSFGQQPAAPLTAQKSLFPASQPSSTSDLFSKPSEKVSAPPSRPSSQSSTLQPPPTSQLGRAASTQSGPATVPDNEKKTLKALNEGLMAHLATQDPREDWSKIVEYYLQQAAKIQNKPAPSLTALSAPPAKAAPTPSQSTERPNLFARSSVGDAAPANPPAKFSGAQPALSQDGNVLRDTRPAAAAPTTRAPSLFQQKSAFGDGDAQKTPKPSFTQPPSTAPVNRKRSAEDEAERPPATEKRAKGNEAIEYPKLPDNASNVSKLFFSALENKGVDASKSAKDGAQKENAPPPQSSAPSGGFKPSTSSAFTPSIGGFKPASGGFTPSMPSGGSNNFLSAFGKKASEQEEKDRQKRQDDDYDSEEETKEQWIERDRKEQEKKRLKSLEAAKSGPGFVFKAASAETPPKEADKEKAAESGQGKSLFDRLSRPDATPSDKPSLFASQTPASKTPSSNLFGSTGGPGFSTGSSLFGHLSKPVSGDASKASESAEKGENVEKQTQGTGDKSWKPNTPIKFGASSSAENGSTTPAVAPPAFGNLFGPKTTALSTSSSTGLLNVPGSKPPGISFNFGGAKPSASANESRATTPGVTTDGEGTNASNAGDADNNEPNDEPPANEAQVEDMTGLSADETKGETLLHSVTIAKASKWEDKKDDEGGSAKGWNDKGKGPLYLLKNDETGKVRILLKVPPYGHARMNFPVLKDGVYEAQGKTGKQVTGPFYDHLAAKPGVGKYLIQVGKKEDADEVARILKENLPE